MKDGTTKESKLSWSKKLVRKWFNINTKTEEFQADEVVNEGGDMEGRNSFSEREPSTTNRSRTEKLSKSTERVGGKRVDLDHPQIINVNNYSMFVATWNVGGKLPSNNLNLGNFLHSAPPADIYVLGFQEIVPLNAGNILGVEDNGPAKEWLALIRKMLNNLPGTSDGSGCYTPSPIPNPIAESDVDFEGSTTHKASFPPRCSFQMPGSWRENDPSASNPCLDRRYSVCDNVIFGHRPSDYDPNNRYGHRSSDASFSHRPSEYLACGLSASDYTYGHRPSDSSFGHRTSDYSWAQRSSVSSRRESSDDEIWPGDSSSIMLYSPTEESERMQRNSRYCLVASKQMVGIFLMVWIKSNLREYVGNMKVSCIGRGLMGYLGNKGSISVSMLLHQTSFCFVCTHLTSGQKEGDELRRNADVTEILRKTRFPKVKFNENEILPEPETILEHDRVIWLGDLNYRVALSYRTAKALVEMQNWRALLENDQLRLEQGRGRVFHGWKEGKIYFPPTYKYSNNSDRYSGSVHKEKRRTPAWCDRILWHGRGLHQLSYVRGESRFSDHRPVYSIFWAEVESYQGRLKKSTSRSRSRINVEDLLPYAHGYTEFCFF